MMINVELPKDVWQQKEEIAYITDKKISQWDPNNVSPWNLR